MLALVPSHPDRPNKYQDLRAGDPVVVKDEAMIVNGECKGVNRDGSYAVGVAHESLGFVVVNYPADLVRKVYPGFDM